MTPRWQWAIFLFLMTGLCGCRHSYQHYAEDYLREAERIRWDTTQDAHEEQEQYAEQSQQRKSSGKGKATRKLPDGTVEKFDWSWVDEAVEAASQTVRAEADTKQASRGQADRQKEAAHREENKGSTAWHLPWWAWVAGAVVLALILWRPARLALAFIRARSVLSRRAEDTDRPG